MKSRATTQLPIRDALLHYYKDNPILQQKISSSTISIKQQLQNDILTCELETAPPQPQKIQIQNDFQDEFLIINNKKYKFKYFPKPIGNYTEIPEPDDDFGYDSRSTTNYQRFLAEQNRKTWILTQKEYLDGLTDFQLDLWKQQYRKEQQYQTTTHQTLHNLKQTILRVSDHQRQELRKEYQQILNLKVLTKETTKQQAL